MANMFTDQFRGAAWSQPANQHKAAPMAGPRQSPKAKRRSPLPSVATLAQVFDDPKQARRILEMTRAELEQTEAGAARVRQCLNRPDTWDIRMHVLSANDAGLHGVEAISLHGGCDFAEYLNTGDTYAPTLIRYHGGYRVQSVGDFVETLERRGVRVN